MARAFRCPAPPTVAADRSRHYSNLPSSSCSDPPMVDLEATYQQISRPWPHDQLAALYRAANRHGRSTVKAGRDAAFGRPVSLLATATPSCASLSVAIHVLHVLPSTESVGVAEQLLARAERDAADVLRCCRAVLELDGRNHDYGVDEWLPVAYDIAAPLLEHARLDREPPSVVEYVQDAIGWLARAIISLDQDSADTPATLSDAIGRLLVVCAFANAARDRRADD